MMKNYSASSIIERESSAWSMLDGEIIFMTGGTGFFGVSMLYSLFSAKKKHNLNIHITILTRNIRKFKNNHPVLSGAGFIDFIQGDVVDFDFPDKKFSKIFHFATTSANETFNGEDQLKKYKTLINGTERVMRLAGICGANKVIFTSSGVAYGQPPEEMIKIDESYFGALESTNPAVALAQGKRSAEFIIAYYAEKYGIDYVVARCFSFVGPLLPLNLHYAIGNFVFDALYKDSIKIKGDGSAIRSYMDVSDLIVWVLIFSSSKCKYRMYNIGSDYGISILDLAKKVRDIVSPNKEIDIQGDKDYSVGNFSRNFYVPNINRSRKEHGLDVWVDLEQAVYRLTSE
jgi:UDP-glucuronate decarboxylase